MSDPFAVSGEPELFEISGQKFRLRALPCDRSLAGLDLLQKSVFPVISEILGLIDMSKLAAFFQASEASSEASSEAEGLPDVFKDVKTEGDFTKALQQALSITGTLQNFYALFAPHCDCFIVANPETGSEACLLVSQSTTVFARKSALCVSWILHCLAIEYSDFLSGTGLGQILKAGNQLKSRLGSGPKSG